MFNHKFFQQKTVSLLVASLLVAIIATGILLAFNQAEAWQFIATVTTQIHNSGHQDITNTTVPVGTVVHDKAIVTGTGPTPTGTIDFNRFNNGTCDGNPVATQTVALVGGIAESSTFTTIVGAMSYKVHYNGDINYSASETNNGACELLTVSKATPSLQTTPNPSSGTIGIILNDSAVLSGGYIPTGSITFKLYGPTNPICTGAPIFTNSVSVNGNGIYNTNSGFTSNAAGTWRWVASYSGDSNNNSITSGCNDEQVTVTNNISRATRTPGFWQTHTRYTSTVFAANFGGGMSIGSAPHKGSITNISFPGASQLFGAFYSSIPKTTAGVNRSPIDRARMQLLQQLVAAKLNCAAFGCSGATTALIASADAAYAGSSASAILASVGTLGAYNSSGDSIPVSGTGPVTPLISQSLANKTFWDNP